MNKKTSLIIACVGVLVIILGVILYLFNAYDKGSSLDWFFVLELKTDTTVTVEPKKLLITLDGEKKEVSSSEMQKFVNYFDDYFKELKEYKIEDNSNYLWSIIYQDKQLANYVLGADEYPLKWEEFLDALNDLIGYEYYKEDEELEVKEDLTVKSVSTINFNDTCRAYNCTYSLKTDNRTLLLEFKRTAGDDEGFSNQKLILNNKELISDDFLCGGPEKLKVIGDNVVVLYHYGCDSQGDTLTAYNLSGEILFNYDNLDEMNPGMYILDSDFEIKDNDILIDATRMAPSGELYVNETHSIDYCDEEQLLDYQITDDTIVSGTYKIPFIDGKYDKPIIYSQQTFKDAKLLDGCNLE